MRLKLGEYNSLPHKWIVSEVERKIKKRAAQDQAVNNAYMLNLLYSQISGIPTYSVN